MVDIYRSFLNFPRDVLFVPGPKLQEPGFRWAPTSFLDQEQTFFWRAQKPGTRTDEGFQIYNDYIIFHEELDLQFDQEAHPGIHFVTTPGNGGFAFQRSETKLVQSFKASAIILQLEGFENISRSVVFSHLVEREGIVYCNYESNVNTWKVNEFTMDDINYCAGESDDQERSHTTSGYFHS
jgi:hypothetical protein